MVSDKLVLKIDKCLSQQDVLNLVDELDKKYVAESVALGDDFRFMFTNHFSQPTVFTNISATYLFFEVNCLNKFKKRTSFQIVLEVLKDFKKNCTYISYRDADYDALLKELKKETKWSKKVLKEYVDSKISFLIDEVYLLNNK